MTLFQRTAAKFGIRMFLAFNALIFCYNHSFQIPPGTNDDIMAIRPNAVGSAEWFMEKYDCWQSGNHDYPGHVIARTDAGDWKRLGPKAVGATLSGKSDLHVAAYCN